jgi:hypothetical protein
VGAPRRRAGKVWVPGGARWLPLERATEIDDRMTRAFVAAVGREPRLKLAGSATPMLQAVPAPA